MLFGKIKSNYIKWGFESRLKPPINDNFAVYYYIKWGFESRLKLSASIKNLIKNYIKWGFESRLKRWQNTFKGTIIISNGDLRVD